MTADVCGFGAKKKWTDLSVCFRSHAKKHIDWAVKVRGLWIRGSVEKMRLLLFQLPSIHLDVDMKLAHRFN